MTLKYTPLQILIIHQLLSIITPLNTNSDVELIPEQSNSNNKQYTYVIRPSIELDYWNLSESEVERGIIKQIVDKPINQVEMKNSSEFFLKRHRVGPEVVIPTPTHRSFDERCCQNGYNQNHFYITTPNFPLSHNQQTQCVFQVARSSPDVCRLKLNFLYFWVGHHDGTCSSGYLQVNGRQYCGCQTGLEIFLNFNDPYFAVANLYYVNNGWDSEFLNGFVIEVVQEACPVRLGDQPLLLTKSTSITAFDDLICKKWTALLWTGLTLNALLYQKSTCERPQTECQLITSRYGSIRSRNYPFNYPSNVRSCYRFTKLQGFCQIQFFFEDFDLEPSVNCVQDYIQFNRNVRWCGQSSLGKYQTFDLYQPGTIVDFLFTTSYFRSANRRGFSMTYQYVPCGNILPSGFSPSITPNILPDLIPELRPNFPYPSNPINPLVPFLPNKVTPVINQSGIGCYRVIQSMDFVLESKDFEALEENCRYLIVKPYADICKLQLEMSVFDLKCDSENLLIDGMEYCGSLFQGKTGLFWDSSFERGTV